MSTIPEIYWPLPLDTVTEWPGQRPKGWAPHYGTDFKCPTGTPLPATSDGRIVFIGDDGLGGMTIDLQRADGLIQRYGHLSQYRVRVGDTVKAGQIIALSGNTGKSLGPHLHWELRWDRAWNGGQWIDPRTLNPKTFGQPAPLPTESDDEEMKPTVHVRTEGNIEYCLAHPDIGKTLKPGAKKIEGKITIFRGHEVTADPKIGVAWARMYAGGAGKETSRTNRADYIAIQQQALRFSVAVHG